MPVRREVKRLAEHALAWSGVPWLSARARRHATLILAYHDIVPHGAVRGGDASLHLPQAQFADQLDALARTHDVVPLDVALGGGAPARSRPRAAITFDDAYYGAVTAGVEELARRALPATIFVPPGLLGGQPFWWDVLAPAGDAGLDAGVRARALATLTGTPRTHHANARRTPATRPPLPSHVRSATEEELSRAAATPGIALGSHTWSHPNLAALDEPELGDELARPLAWLRERYDGVVPVLTYPYGLFSPRVQHAARAAGYEAALRIDGGWLVRGRHDAFDLPRLDVSSGVSAAEGRLRVAGVLS